MTEQEQINAEEMLGALQGFTEAPASLNVYGVTRKGWNIQVTLRDADEFELLKRFGRLVAHFDDIGIAPKPVGQQPLPPRPDAPDTIPSLALPPVPTPPPQTNGAVREAQCVLIEVGKSYQGNKTQLKFTCNGMDYPLLFTKSESDMVSLLAPLGFSPAHIVVGVKYPINCKVFYAENVRDGKTRKDVQRVAVG